MNFSSVNRQSSSWSLRLRQEMRLWAWQFKSAETIGVGRRITELEKVRSSANERNTLALVGPDDQWVEQGKVCTRDLWPVLPTDGAEQVEHGHIENPVSNV